jgi:hypothetical protein
VAVRAFDGSSRLEFDLGNVGDLNKGAFTVAAIAKRTSDGGDNRTVLSAQHSGSSRRSFMTALDNDLLLVSGGIGVESSVNWVSADDWCLVAITKAAGDSTPRFHHFEYDTTTWTHQDGPSTREDDGITILHIAIGQTDQDFGFIGRMAVVGAWESELSDGALEALTDELSAWVSATPDALWPLNQTSVSTAVTDITGGGADQSARVGTSVATGDDPPGFNFNLTETVTGTATADLGALTATATGQTVVGGVALADLGGLSSTATGQRTVHGTAVADLGFTATALAVTRGVAVADLGALAGQATGSLTRYGTALADLGALDATAKGPVTVAGVAVAALGALAATATGDRSQLPRFLLEGPTYVENLWTTDRLFSRYKLRRGITLAMVDGVVSELRYPYQEDLEAYDFVYLGGHVHRVSSFEAQLLTAAGYGAFLTPI